MTDNNDTADPVLRNSAYQHAEKYGTKLINKTEKYQQKVDKTKGHDSSEKKPAGGYDSTPIPNAPPGYTIRITFHRATNLPFADVPTFSSDPYILSIISTTLRKRHKQDSDLRLRTPTIHRDVNPVWNTVWTIAHVPASGFHMKCRLFDEDPADHDDRLGNVHVDINQIHDDWSGFKERGFEIKKRMGSKRAYTMRGCAALFSRNVQMKGEVFISIENLGRSKGDGGRAYTISPLPWSQHFSPLIGLIAGTKNATKGKDGKKGTERYNFQAIQMQLQGPVPEHLYHRYVEFRPFVAGMFTSHTLRGRILNHALHHQHARIYNYDGSTKYGEFEEPCTEMTSNFLDLVHYDQGGRIFTYVITLDGHFRFTETGKEFGIDLLSKHTMHSDVSIYIAFSGEFFVRRLKHSHKDGEESPDPATELLPPGGNESDNQDEKKAEKKKDKKEQKEEKKEQKKERNEEGKEAKKGREEKPEEEQHRPSELSREHSNTLAPPLEHSASGRDLSSATASGSAKRSWSPWKQQSHSATSSTRSPARHAKQTHEGRDPSKDPSHYELIIDNDSGTYRPNAKYLGQLKKYLQHNLPGLHIATLDCQADEEKMQKLKEEQRERKKTSGKQITYMQNASMSSISSSDEEELERRADENAQETNAVKTKLNKVKNLARRDRGEDTSGDGKENGGRKDVGDSSSEQGKHELAKEESTSTGEKASFDTASEHAANHFVTPKPSLGSGGLKSYLPENEDEHDRPLSRGIDEELKRRGIGRSSQEQDRINPYEKANGHTTAGTNNRNTVRSVHQDVTTAS